MSSAIRNSISPPAMPKLSSSMSCRSAEQVFAEQREDAAGSPRRSGTRRHGHRPPLRPARTRRQTGIHRRAAGRIEHHKQRDEGGDERVQHRLAGGDSRRRALPRNAVPFQRWTLKSRQPSRLDLHDPSAASCRRTQPIRWSTPAGAAGIEGAEARQQSETCPWIISGLAQRFGQRVAAVELRSSCKRRPSAAARRY